MLLIMLMLEKKTDPELAPCKGRFIHSVANEQYLPNHNHETAVKSRLK